MKVDIEIKPIELSKLEDHLVNKKIDVEISKKIRKEVIEYIDSEIDIESMLSKDIEFIIKMKVEKIVGDLVENTYKQVIRDYVNNQCEIQFKKINVNEIIENMIANERFNKFFVESLSRKSIEIASNIRKKYDITFITKIIEELTVDLFKKNEEK